MLRTATRLSSKSRSLNTLRRAVEPPHDTKIPLGTWKEALFFGTALATIGGTYLYEKDPTRIQQWINTTTANIQPPIVYAEPRVSGESEDSDSTLRVDHRTTSQHWDTQPQCQLWGSNEYRIVAPDLPKDQIITKPRPLTGLQGQALIDVKLAKTHAAAIDADGHLYQWGSGFDGAEDVNAPEACRQPICTLAGQQIQRIALGASMIFAVNRRGQLLACHASRQQQQEDARYLQPGSWSVKRWWWPFSRRVEPTLGYAVVKLDQPFAGEHVVDVAAGDEHVVALTNHGRVFAATTQQLTAPTEQGGWQATLTLVPGLEREYCVEIACGRAHSVVRTKYGDAYTWGDNQFGQLGLGPFKPSQLHVTRPQLVSALRKPVHQEHGPPLPAGQVIRVAAGGNLTYFILDHGEMASQSVYACGGGQQGQLGTGQFTQVQGTPVRLRSISGLTEYNEQQRRLCPIPIYDISVGETHTALILDTASEQFGRDIYMWGQRQHAQCGLGPKGVSAQPTRPPAWHITDKDTLTGEAIDRLQMAPIHIVHSMIPSRDSPIMTDSGRRRSCTAAQTTRVGYRVTLIFDQITPQ